MQNTIIEFNLSESMFVVDTLLLEKSKKFHLPPDFISKLLKQYQRLKHYSQSQHFFNHY